MTGMKKEGSARRQANRSVRYAATSRYQQRIIAAERREKANLLLKTIGQAIAGVAALFAIMWLACAY